MTIDPPRNGQGGPSRVAAVAGGWRRTPDIVIPTQRGPSDSPLPAGRPAHETTRYLCAAAHTDADFGDRAIAEYLVERTRAVPPSPGLDAVSVLRDALAARARRRIRDGVVLVLLAGTAVVNPVSLLLWSVAALLAARRVAWPEGKWPRRAAAVAVPVSALTVALVVLPATQLLGLGPMAAGTVWPTTALAVSLLAVIGVDSMVVHRLAHRQFRRSRFVDDPRRAGAPWERAVRGLGHAPFLDQLERIGRADEHSPEAANRADVIVHRGHRPFVGAGIQLKPRIIALPLNPAGDEDRTPEAISNVELHSRVAMAVRELASARSLVPGERLERVLHREQVLMHAERLVTHTRVWPGSEVMPDLDQPPFAHMSLPAARRLADRPVEWARYYGCYRIESWDGEIATSCYLYATTDSRMIYLTLTYCVLPPIEARFRDIDDTVEPGDGPVSCTAGEFLLLPITVLRRVRTARGRLPRLRQRTAELNPDRYGAGRSLRELASGQEYAYDNQKADVDHYLAVVTITVLRAVTDYLEQCGFDVVEFRKAVHTTTIINTVTVSGGTQIGGTFGAGQTTGGGSTTTGDVTGSN